MAMGRVGSDLALDTADAVIVRDELSTIPAVIALSRRARRLVVTNLVIAGVCTAGLHVARILVPGYYSNAAAGLPFLGGSRLPDGKPRLLPLPH
jgi:cation transport ATPase